MKLKKISMILLSFSVFISALLPRIISLGVTATADQHLWIARSIGFIKNVFAHNWKGTFFTASPGVTTMWLSGISLYLHHIYLKGISAIQLFFAAELPVALVASATVLLSYFLIKKIFGQQVALLSSCLIAFDPFFIAHSRCAHMDALVSSFMILSVLSFLVYLTNSRIIRYLVFSGVFGGLALLTKLSAFFLIPFIALAIIIWYVQELFQCQGYIRKARILSILKIGAIWLLVLIVVFIALWPAMWTQPKQTLGLLYSAFREVKEVTHGSGFFMGKVSDGSYTGIYGLFFYIISFIMRLTPVTLISFIFYTICYFSRLKKNGFGTLNKNVFLLYCYFFFFTLMASLISKKGGRYLLPVFPAVDILAALGICHFVSSIKRVPFRLAKYKNTLTAFIFICAIGLQAGSALPLHPYYLAYYNPLIGGASVAKDILTVGWGEGMDQAARFLNKKAGAKDLTVAVQYTAFQPYFVGKTVWMDRSEQADYLVFYLSAMQRHWHYSLWKEYRDKTPEHVVRINNIDYAWIYKVER